MPNVRPSAHLTSLTRFAVRSPITSSTARPCCCSGAIGTVSRTGGPSLRACNSPTSASSPNHSRAPPTPTSSPSPERAESLGYGAFFRSDHYLAMGGGDGLPGPTDAWVTLGRHRPGDLDDPSRHPGHVGDVPAPRAAGDHRRPGRRHVRRPRRARARRGWYEAEHEAYGIEFPPLGERFDRLEEQLEIITGTVGDTARRDVRLARRALSRDRIAGAAQAGPVARSHRDRRWRTEADPGTGRPLRVGVQRPVRTRRVLHRAVRSGPGRLRGDRP